MNIADIKKFDVANGTGVRTSVFVSGCEHNCKGCFNQIAKDFAYGEEFNGEVLELINTYVSNENVVGLSILGGEPMNPKNLEGVFTIITYIKAHNPNKSIWLWSGYTYDELIARKCMLTISILQSIDVLVDGKFDINKKDLTLKYKGSSNQRVIDIPLSLKENKIILLEERIK